MFAAIGGGGIVVGGIGGADGGGIGGADGGFGGIGGVHGGIGGVGGGIGNVDDGTGGASINKHEYIRSSPRQRENSLSSSSERIVSRQMLPARE